MATEVPVPLHSNLPGALRRARQRSGPFILSAVLHVALIVLLARLVGVSTPSRERGPLYISFVAMLAEPADRPGPAAEQPQAEPTPQPRPMASPAVVHEEPPGSENPRPLPPGPAVLAVRGTSGSTDDLYGRRGQGNRWSAVVGGGGGIETESAVHAALVFLARYQSPDGSWDAANFATQAGVTLGRKQIGPGYDDPLINPGVSGLALLAFLAAGNTHRGGEFRDTVASGLRYVISLQRPDGRFTARLSPGRDPYLIYNQSICTIVLGEACAISGDSSLRPALSKSVSFLQGTQQVGGGWDYDAAATQRDDASITGWVVMALKSAQAAGVEIPWIMLFNVIRHLETATLDSGEVIYANLGAGVGRKGISMVAVGMTARQFLGWPASSKILRQQARLVSRAPMRWDRLDNDAAQDQMESSYYWYYATLAMYQSGGRFWPDWNETMKAALLPHQVREGPLRGSWDPVGLWAGTGGRLYATALNTLNLEVYYRYLPLYEAEPLNGVGALAVASRSSNAAQRLAALRLLRDFDRPAAIAALADALGDPSEEIRLTAAQSLAEQSNRLAIPSLLELARSQNGFSRFQVLQALDRYELPALAPHYVRMLDDSERFVRAQALKRLERWSGDAFGYDPDAAAEPRAAAIQRFHRWWDKARQSAPLAALEGKVVAVDRERRLVFVDIGRNQGVVPNDLLAVMRRGKFIALLSAQEELADSTVAAVVPEFAKGEVLQSDTIVPSSPMRTPGD